MSVTIGTTYGGIANTLPFDATGVVDYEQIYSAAAFSGPISFNTITFFDTQFPGSLSAICSRRWRGTRTTACGNADPAKDAGARNESAKLATIHDVIGGDADVIFAGWLRRGRTALQSAPAIFEATFSRA
jgi:hypothetical protein